MDVTLLTTDLVSPYLANVGEFNQHTFLRTLVNPPFTQRQFEHAIYQLESDGYVNRIATSSYEFSVTPKGRRFIYKGGYGAKENRNKIKQEHSAKKAELEIEQLRSVIDTNRSVRKSNKLIPLLTGALVIVSVFGLIREIIKDKQQSQTELLLKEQLIKLDSLNRILQKTDALIK